MFLQPLGFLIYMTAGIAETNRAPFDFPEAEQELVAGYHTEYSSMSFAMFFLAEYINMVTVSAVATDLFLGGWHGPFLPESLGWIWFLLKVGGDAVLLRLDALDAAALPLRPADGVRLEGAAAAGGREPARRPRRACCTSAPDDDRRSICSAPSRSLASLLVIAQRNPIYSVLLLIASFGALSGLYVLLDAPFVAVIQIIVYAGAIMVLFLFVVMLLNAPHEETELRRARRTRCCGRGPMRFGAAAGARARRRAGLGADERGGESGAFPRRRGDLGRARSAGRCSPTTRSRSR